MNNYLGHLIHSWMELRSPWHCQEANVWWKGVMLCWLAAGADPPGVEMRGRERNALVRQGLAEKIWVCIYTFWGMTRELRRWVSLKLLNLNLSPWLLPQCALWSRGLRCILFEWLNNADLQQSKAAKVPPNLGKVGFRLIRLYDQGATGNCWREE